VGISSGRLKVRVEMTCHCEKRARKTTLEIVGTIRVGSGRMGILPESVGGSLSMNVERKGI
jgi:hypothetical protein